MTTNKDIEAAIKIEEKSLALCLDAIEHEDLRAYLSNEVVNYFKTQANKKTAPNCIYNNLDYTLEITDEVAEALHTKEGLTSVLKEMVPSFDLAMLVFKASKALYIDLSAQHKALCDARNDLASAHYRLVGATSRQFKVPSDQVEDKIQEGYLGLLRTAEKFNHRVGTTFSTYATRWLKSFFISFLNESKMIRTTRANAVLAKKIAEFKQQYESVNSVQPSLDMIASHFDVKEAEVKRVIDYSNNSNVYSFDYYYNQEDNRVLEVADDEDLEEKIMDELTEEEVLRHVNDMLADLKDDRAATILKMRFGLGEFTSPVKTKDIAEAVGISRQRVDQVVEQCIGDLRVNRKWNRKFKALNKA